MWLEKVSYLVYGVPARSVHLSASVCSVFVKKQKKVDPEVAKIREERKRRSIEREIRELQKHSKKPKPIDEMTIDIVSAKNIDERMRDVVVVDAEEMDRRAIIFKEYQRERNQRIMADDRWLRNALSLQDDALKQLRQLSPQLYAAAVSCEGQQLLPLKVEGPGQTAPRKDYVPPDGDYIDVTRTWTL